MTKLFPTADVIVIRTSAREVGHISGTQLSCEDFFVRHVSGLSVGEYGILDSSFGDRITDTIRAETMSSSIGEWCAIAEARDGENAQFLVFGDAYGYAPIFYSLVPGDAIIISTSFNGVATKLADLGISPHLDVDNYTATLATWREQFAIPRAGMTMAREITLLPLDKTIVVRDSSVFLASRSEVSPIESSWSYEEILSRGHTFLQTVIERIADLNQIQKGLLLSGGVDSRLVLSLILSAGKEKAFRVKTSDPRDYSNSYTRKIYEKDAQLANEIRDAYGMKWMDRNQVRSVPVSFREALLVHQGYGSNFSYNFRPIQQLSFQNSPMITLRGGGGEILRSTTTGSNIVSAVAQDRELSELPIQQQFSSWFMEHAVQSTVFDERINNYVQQGMTVLKGSTLVARLNNFYLHTRNRSHFGHARKSRSQNEIPFQLLSNSFYLEASQRIPFQEKAEGRMVADIFCQTTPALLDFPFESPTWNSRLASERASARRIDLQSWVTEFDRLKIAKGGNTSSGVWTREERGGGAAITNESLLSYVKSAFQLLEDLADEDLREFHSQILAWLRKGKLKVGSLIGKVASAVDVYFPSVPLGTVLTLETAQSSTVSSFISTSIAPPLIVQDGWNNRGFPEFKPRISLHNGLIEIDAGLTVGAEAGLTYAFYLYRDDERIEAKWYGTETRIAFASEIQPGNYHGRLFVKAPHISKPVLIRNTEILSIDN